MKNRASSHLILLFALVVFEVIAYFALGRSALIRGYETSWVGGLRDLFLYVPIIALVLWLSRTMNFKGNWTLYTTAILLFSIGMLVQYRLYSDPEYNARNKAAARAEKTDALRIRYINDNYDDAKKQMMGFPTGPSGAVATQPVPVKQSSYSLENALVSSYTWIPIFSLLAFAGAYWLCVRERFLSWMQRNSFIIVVATLIPLTWAVITSSAGKALGNTTPWEPSKIPFLIGFAGILTSRYKDLARTYWALPRA